jgi:hypothetical protein
MERTRIGRNEHEKIKHKLNHQEQRDLLATPWDIWERKNDEEYVEPEYAYIEEDVTEQEEGIIWIEGGVIYRQRTRKTDDNIWQGVTRRWSDRHDEKIIHVPKTTKKR